MRRQEGAEDLLHHEGGVGAEHDHLAVRHVDDAHDAEGDGEPDGGEQQDAAEADALEQGQADADQLQPAVDRAERAVDGVLDVGIVGGGALVDEQTADLRVGRCRERADGGKALLLGAAAQPGGGERQRQRRLDPRVALGGIGLLQRVGALVQRMLQRLLRRREPILGAAAEQGQAAQRRIDLAAHAVVDAHLVDGVVRALAESGVIDGIVELVLVAVRLGDDELVIGGGVERAVLQRPEHRNRVTVAERAERADGGDLGVEIVGSELADELLEIGGARRLRERRQRQQSQ